MVKELGDGSKMRFQTSNLRNFKELFPSRLASASSLLCNAAQHVHCAGVVQLLQFALATNLLVTKALAHGTLLCPLVIRISFAFMRVLPMLSAIIL